MSFSLHALPCLLVAIIILVPIPAFLDWNGSQVTIIKPYILCFAAMAVHHTRMPRSTTRLATIYSGVKLLVLQSQITQRKYSQLF